MTDLLGKLGLEGFFQSERVTGILLAVAVLVFGTLAARLLSASITRVLSKRLSRQETMLVRRFSFGLLFGIVIVWTLSHLGIQIGVLLGAAGILTVAIGFASQTSASNIISGLFLIAERSFEVGDYIRIGDMTGEVLSIDLLSVKLRTFDNLFIRVPNEELIKSRITNLTHFPIRRVDLKIGVAYKEDTERVRKLLLDIADRNPVCLEEPPPLFIFQDYGDSALEYQFSVWARRESFLDLKTSMMIQIKDAFDENGIEIPFPHRSLYTGSVTEPLPIRIVDQPREANGKPEPD